MRSIFCVIVVMTVAELSLLTSGSLDTVSAGPVLPGDVNCDRERNSIDAALILQLDARRITALECPEAGDVNRDGATNSIDAALVLQLSAGLITEFPTCDTTASPPDAQLALDATGPGQTLCLAPGTYNQLFVYRKTGITILGAGAGTTTVRDVPDHHTCLLVLESNDITIDGVGARDCEVQAAFAGDSTNVVFRRVETGGGPIGFQYQRSSGRIEASRARDHESFGAIVQQESDVTIDASRFEGSGFGILAQSDATLRVSDGTVVNNEGGVFTVGESGTTSIDDSTIANNGLNIFAGVPGCANLPPADATPPQCFLDDPAAFVSDITLSISDSTVSGSEGTGVVIFPGVQATLRRNTIDGSALTGLFVWGARVTGSDNSYGGNVENGIECRAYPDPSTGDRGMCAFSNERIHDSQPLSGNRLGGGFVSEGGEFRLEDSVIENNWGIGVQVLHGGKGSITGNTIRNNGGTAYCISNATWTEVQDNVTSGNRAGECLGHP